MRKMTFATWALIASPMACASGGHGLNGSDEMALYQRMSGDWTFNVEESTDLARALREASAKRGRGSEAGSPGGVTGRPGGGRRGGAGRGGGGERSGGRPPGPAGGQQPLDPAGFGVDSVLTVNVGAEGVALYGGPMTSLEVPTTDEVMVLPRRGSGMEARAKWDEQVLVVERKFKDGPKIVDRYESRDAARLVLKRKVDLPRSGSVELLIVFDRAEEPQ